METKQKLIELENRMSDKVEHDILNNYLNNIQYDISEINIKIEALMSILTSKQMTNVEWKINEIKRHIKLGE